MSPTEPLDQIDSGPQPPSLRRGVLVAGAVVLALGATALTGAALAGVVGAGTTDPTSLAAATGSASPTSSTKEKGQKPKGLKPWKLMHRGPHLLGGLGAFGALHGEFVVSDGSGGYRTMVIQRGTASSVSGSTLTVKSEDGVSMTYDVPASSVVGAQRDGLASIDKGANVMVTAEKKGSTLTAKLVVDLDSLRDLRPGPPGGMGWRDHGPGMWPDDDETTPST